MDRVIIHSDANCFYASVEMLYHPELAGKPLAVGGDPEARHGIVLTANYIAKKRGVKTGMALWQARQACPDIIFVPARMDLYLKFSSMLREIYSEYTDKIEPYGCDEAWLDISDSISLKGDGRKIADEIMKAAMELFRNHYDWSHPIRSLGVRGADLVTADIPVQMSLFMNEERRAKQEMMDKAVDEIRRRFGYFSIQRAFMYQDKILSKLDAQGSHTVHPVGYFNGR